MDRKHVVLIGAGHAHLYVAANAHRFVERGIDLTLVAPGRLWYSGMASGMLAGRYTPEQASIDPELVVTRGGGRLICAQAEMIDREKQTISLDTGNTLGYDLLSINIGSEIRNADRFADAWKVKPISNLVILRKALIEWFSELASANPVSTADPTRIVVIGGGPSGCEIAGNLAAVARHHDVPIEIMLLTREGRLLANHPHQMARSVETVLQQRGIVCRYGVTVVEMEHDRVATDAGETLHADFVVAATGLRASGQIDRWGLVSEASEGGMPVDASLRCTFDPRVFGAGDCITFRPRPLPKIGVFGVRQGPILLHNLLATSQSEPLRTYKPQKNYLTILNLGQGIGCALRGNLHWTGRTSLRWKDWLDRRFVARYR